MEDVWKWDYWCQLQPKTGKCTEEEHFYYDAQIDACQTFIYSGCDGNQNNFAKLIDCERHCKDCTYSSQVQSVRDPCFIGEFSCSDTTASQ
ncbi:unnamed protein product [Spodoptera exigua]|nr:unnamed protein product [Spodoptera exigua]